MCGSRVALLATAAVVGGIWAGCELMEPSLPVRFMGLLAWQTSGGLDAAVRLQDGQPIPWSTELVDKMEANLVGVRWRRSFLEGIASKFATAAGLTVGPRCPERGYLAAVAGGRPAELGGAIKVKVYDPPGGREAANGRVYMYVHGGGFVFGEAGMNEGMHCAVSARANVTIVSVDYRLTPRHVFPAAFDDTVAAAVSLVRDGVPGKDGGAPTPVRSLLVGGDSAGGNLALGLAVWASSDPAAAPSAHETSPDRSVDAFADPAPRSVGFSDEADVALRASVAGSVRAALAGMVLVYPKTRCAKLSPSMRDLSEGHLLTRASVQRFTKLVYPGRVAATEEEWAASGALVTHAPTAADRRAFPETALRPGSRVLTAPLPPSVTVLAQYDVLRDDGTDAVALLRSRSSAEEHRLVSVPRSTHGFVTVPELFPHGWPVAVDAIVDFVRKAHGDEPETRMAGAARTSEL